jgi:hypothetical protein
MKTQDLGQLLTNKFFFCVLIHFQVKAWLDSSKVAFDNS